MGVHCQILIQRPRDGVHKAGGTVSGSVRYAVDEPFEYKYIIISLEGEGLCIFPSLKPSLTLSQTCMGEHDFVRETKYISPGIRQEKYCILPVGTYESEFNFVLPKNIPYPYKDNLCKLTYRIELRFETPSIFKRKEFSAPINVLAYVTPNLPEENTAFGLEKTLIRPFSQKTHTINLKGKISNTFFTPGQNAELSFAVTNDTDTAIYSIESKLVRYTTYRGDCGRTKENVAIIKESAVETPGVPANGIANLTSVMPVPENAYTIQNCKIIQIQYRVRVTVRLYMPYTNASTEIPVVIGHKYIDENTEVASAVTEKSGCSFAEAAIEATECDDDSPPSYWEVMMECKGK